MEKLFNKLSNGYQEFRNKYAASDHSIMNQLADGQSPQIMVVSCCDSRVDPGLILQCEPGELFVVRNVASIIPPYEIDDAHHGTSAALEFGIKHLNVKHLILMGHSQCGGIKALIDGTDVENSDFIKNWISIINKEDLKEVDVDECVKKALHQSYQNAMNFPWIKERIENKTLMFHIWFFDIKSGKLFSYNHEDGKYYEFSR